MSSINESAQSVLDFWYPPGKGLKDYFGIWFGGKELDPIIREKFGSLVSISLTKTVNAKMKSIINYLNKKSKCRYRICIMMRSSELLINKTSFQNLSNFFVKCLHDTFQIESARTGQLKSWEDNAKTALAHIILIDQFCRSIYRVCNLYLFDLIMGKSSKRRVFFLLCSRVALALVASWRSPPRPPYNLKNHNPFKTWSRPTFPFRPITPPQKKVPVRPLLCSKYNFILLYLFIFMELILQFTLIEYDACCRPKRNVHLSA